MGVSCRSGELSLPRTTRDSGAWLTHRLSSWWSRWIQSSSSLRKDSGRQRGFRWRISRVLGAISTSIKLA